MAKNDKSNTDKKQEVTENKMQTVKNVDLINKENEIQSLKDEVNELKSLLKSLIVNQNNNQNSQSVQKPISDIDRWVKIIHLEERAEGLTTHIELSTRNLDFRFFGEERLVRFTEFEELVGKYLHWFEGSMLVLGEEDSDLVEKYRLTKISTVGLEPNQLSNLKNLSLKELEDLYKRVSDQHKRLITRKFVHGYYELKDSQYGDRKKIDLLNELSGGSLQNMLDDLLFKAKKK